MFGQRREFVYHERGNVWKAARLFEKNQLVSNMVVFNLQNRCADWPHSRNTCTLAKPARWPSQHARQTRTPACNTFNPTLVKPARSSNPTPARNAGCNDDDYDAPTPAPNDTLGQETFPEPCRIHHDNNRAPPCMYNRAKLNEQGIAYRTTALPPKPTRGSSKARLDGHDAAHATGNHAQNRSLKFGHRSANYVSNLHFRAVHRFDECPAHRFHLPLHPYIARNYGCVPDARRKTQLKPTDSSTSRDCSK
jgi:hypothetical protein